MLLSVTKGRLIRLATSQVQTTESRGAHVLTVHAVAELNASGLLDGLLRLDVYDRGVVGIVRDELGLTLGLLSRPKMEARAKAEMRSLSGYVARVIVRDLGR